MRVLLDNGAPRGIARSLRDQCVTECREEGWDALGNGELLQAAEAAGFAVLLTTDRNIGYQQHLSNRRIAIVVPGSGGWRLIQSRLAEVSATVNAAIPGSYIEVDIPY